MINLKHKVHPTLGFPPPDQRFSSTKTVYCSMSRHIVRH